MEEIQDDIETELMKEQAFEVAKAYVRYRYKHEMKRNGNGIDRKILTIVDGVNEEVIQENSIRIQQSYLPREIISQEKSVRISQETHCFQKTFSTLMTKGLSISMIRIISYKECITVAL